MSPAPPQLLAPGIPAPENGIEIAGVAHLLTCWGSGRINVRRAPEDVLRTSLVPIVGRAAVDRLLELRDPELDPPVSVAQMADRIGPLPSTRRSQLRRLLTEQTDAYGLWIWIQTPQRTWYRFAVVEQGREGPQITRFDW